MKHIDRIYGDLTYGVRFRSAMSVDQADYRPILVKTKAVFFEI